MTFFKWSKTAATNATADATINWAEGQAPSSVNDSARAMMAAAAKYRDDISGTITTGGTSTAYTVTSNQVFNSLANMSGKTVSFIPHVTNGSTVTLNVDGLGAKPLRSAPSTELVAGTLLAGVPYTAVYNNSTVEWILLNLYGQVFSTILAADGSVSAPSYSFANDTDSGTYRIGANNIGYAANGAKVLDIATTGLGVTGSLITTTSVTAGNGFTVNAGAVTLPAASVAIAALVLAAASQAQMEAASSNVVFSTPGVQHHHPGHPKAWVKFDSAGSASATYNVSSVTDNGPGDFTTNFTTAFSSGNYTFSANAGIAATLRGAMQDSNTAQATTAIRILFRNSSNSLSDGDNHYETFVGDQ